MSTLPPPSFRPRFFVQDEQGRDVELFLSVPTLPADKAAALRTAIEDVLTYRSPAKLKQRAAFIADAERIAASMANSRKGSRLSLPSDWRRCLDRASRALAAAVQAAKAHPDADMMIADALRRRGTRVTGPNFPENREFTMSAGDVLQEMLAASREARALVTGYRPTRKSILTMLMLSELADSYAQHMREKPTTVAAGSGRDSSNKFERIARAFCRAAGERGPRHAVLVQAVARHRKARAQA
jgi:hypothetical protein